MKRQTSEEVEREILALDTLGIDALQDRWRELYKVEPPFKIRSRFFRLAISYRLQELAFGGLKAETRRQLRKLTGSIARDRGTDLSRANGVGDDNALTRASSVRARLSPGTQLMREWNGTTMIVDVMEQGYGWRGKTHRTLSAVAVAITGTKWSGPKFFGLRTKPERSS